MWLVVVVGRNEGRHLIHKDGLQSDEEKILRLRYSETSLPMQHVSSQDVQVSMFSPSPFQKSNLLLMSHLHAGGG
jgi:hypothetical protein